MGIAHRDIKPENIMFADTDLHSDPKLIDFGLANKFDTSHFKFFPPLPLGNLKPTSAPRSTCLQKSSTAPTTKNATSGVSAFSSTFCSAGSHRSLG